MWWQKLKVTSDLIFRWLYGVIIAARPATCATEPASATDDVMFMWTTPSWLDNNVRWFFRIFANHRSWHVSWRQIPATSNASNSKLAQNSIDGANRLYLNDCNYPSSHNRYYTTIVKIFFRSPIAQHVRVDGVANQAQAKILAQATATTTSSSKLAHQLLTNLSIVTVASTRRQLFVYWFASNTRTIVWLYHVMCFMYNIKT